MVRQATGIQTVTGTTAGGTIEFTNMLPDGLTARFAYSPEHSQYIKLVSRLLVVGILRSKLQDA